MYRKNLVHSGFAVSVAGALMLVCGDPAFGATTKKLIELGYDIPDTSFLRDNIKWMKENEPFDGVVYSARPSTGVGQEFTWGAWGNPTVARSSLQHAVNELQATNQNGYAENYLRFTCTPGNVDWYDNSSSVIANNASAGWLATQGGTKGVFLDLESYEGQLWDYRAAKYKSTLSFSQYSAQVRLRGQQLMNAIQADSPNLTLMLPVSYSYVWGPSQINGNISNLPNVEYGLLPSFLDGMLDVAGPGIKFVDGYEAAYGFETAAQFQTARTRILSDTLPIVADDAKYGEKFKVGFAVWLDAYWRTMGWHSDPAQFNQNYYTPAEFENVVKYALQASDEYVWLYDEQLFWRSSNTVGSPDVPQAYIDAVKNALAAVQPGWFRASGDWNASFNWRGAVPNGVGSIALFPQPGNGSTQTVYTNIPVTVGTLRLDAGNNYIIAGAGPLTIQTSSGSGIVDVLQGSQKINLPLIFASNTNVTVASGSTLTIGNPTTIKTNKAVTKTGTVILEAPLTLEAGASLVSSSGVLTVFGAPSLGSGARITLGTGTLTVDYRGLSTPASTIKGQLQTGYAAGAWNGPGINSASAIAGQTGLGWVDDPANQKVVVKLTRYGDANLSGLVDSVDFNSFVAGYGNASAGIWRTGDFNYDSKVNTLDFNLLSGNFGQVAPSEPLLGSFVPEPSSAVTLLALAMIKSLRVRRGTVKSV